MMQPNSEGAAKLLWIGAPFRRASPVRVSHFTFPAPALHWTAHMIHDATLDDLLQKVWDGARIDPAEARRLHELPLEELGALADRRRQLLRAHAHGGRGNEIVTYIVDRNVNYTNVCNVYCKFCA